MDEEAHDAVVGGGRLYARWCVMLRRADPGHPPPPAWAFLSEPVKQSWRALDDSLPAFFLDRDPRFLTDEELESEYNVVIDAGDYGPIDGERLGAIKSEQVRRVDGVEFEGELRLTTGLAPWFLGPPGLVALDDRNLAEMLEPFVGARHRIRVEPL